jgi:hypothetical protein
VSLFVGGIRDGDWFRVPDDRETWTMRERPTPVRVTWPLPQTVESTTIRQETYKRIRFRGEKDTYSVYAANGLTADDVLLRLLEGYVPQVQTS